MRIADITLALATNIIRHTNRFSDIIPNTSFVSVTGSNLLIQTSAAHTLTGRELVALPQRRVITDIANVELLTPSTFRITTATDNDLTQEYSIVTFSGFTDSAWNGNLQLLRTYDRRTFDVKNPMAVLPILNGGEKLREIRELGLYKSPLLPVSIVSPTQFNIDLGVDYDGFVIDPGPIVSRVRVSGTVNLERMIAKYSDQPSDSFWAFVAPADNGALLSKSRHAATDSRTEQGTNSTSPELFNDGFEVYIFAPTSDQTAALRSLDICRHGLLLPMVRSLRGLKFPSGLSTEAEHTVSLTGHRVAGYDKAYLIYNYSFEAPYTITNCDVNDLKETLSFNTIILHTQLENGTSFGTATIDLEEEI